MSTSLCRSCGVVELRGCYYLGLCAECLAKLPAAKREAAARALAAKPVEVSSAPTAFSAPFGWAIPRVNQGGEP